MSSETIQPTDQDFFFQAIRAYAKLYETPEGLQGRVMQAAHYMRVNYAHPLRIEQIAAAAHLSRFHFIRSFRRLYGRTPHQYLMSVRLQVASTLLANGLRVKDVCREVGFESTTSFCLLFRRHYGCTPAQFSKRRES